MLQKNSRDDDGNHQWPHLRKPNRFIGWIGGMASGYTRDVLHLSNLCPSRLSPLETAQQFHPRTKGGAQLLKHHDIPSIRRTLTPSWPSSDQNLVSYYSKLSSGLTDHGLRLIFALYHSSPCPTNLLKTRPRQPN